MPPFDNLQRHFTEALAAGHVVVEAPTGTGKSTKLPLWALSSGPVAVVEPRRLACRALARRVAEVSGAKLGDRVGYAVRFDSRCSTETELLFLTPGIALHWLAEGRLDRFSTVMLDEFHERRWDTDLLAALLKRRGGHRLIVTSATVEGERLARWLGAARLVGEGAVYPVEVRYTEDLALPTLRNLEQRLVAAVEQALMGVRQGDVLVFLPGRGEIEGARQALARILDTELIPLHAGTDNRTQDRALAPADHHRVILATNVAETSLTIPGVTVVIDSGLERRTHHRNGRTVLGLHPISRAAAEQRKGRAGRVAPGLCLRLWGRQARLDSFTPPEVQREELTDLFLAAATAGTPATDLDFPDPLPEHAVVRALDRLRAMAAIDDAGALTEHGRRLAPLPLDPLFAHLITAMPDTATRAAMVDLAAALTVNRRLLHPPRDEAAARSLAAWSPEPCDATTLIRLMRSDPPHEVACDGTGIKEARRIARQVGQTLSLPADPGERIPRDALLEAAIRAVPELAYVRRKRRSRAFGNGQSEVEAARESRCPEEASAAVVFDEHSIPARGTLKTLNIATCMAPVEYTTLARLDLGEEQYGPPHWEEGALRVARRRIYAGVTVAEQEVEPRGAPARTALAEAILRGRLLKPAGRRLQVDIAAWNLWLDLGHGEGEMQSPQSWLEERLRNLGVERAEDIALIEAEDLRFAGIPEWEREAFDRKHPLELRLEKLTVTVHYDGRRKRITLERCSGTRRTDPRRIELPAWPGWRIFYRSASREVEIR